MARPHKIMAVSTGKIGRGEQAERQKREQELKAARTDLLIPPDWLSPAAVDEYMSVIRETEKIGTLDNLDKSVLAVYADNYARYVEAAAKLQEYGLTVATEKGLAPSPFINIADKAAAVMMKCSMKLGLAATDRLRLTVPKKEEKPANKFAKYIKAV